MNGDRYYVQRLSSQEFLVRQAEHRCRFTNGDRIVRRFEDADDASYYVKVANELQRQLDQRYGLWMHRAV